METGIRLALGLMKAPVWGGAHGRTNCQLGGNEGSTDKGCGASAGTRERLSLADPDPPVWERAAGMGLSHSAASLWSSVPSH